ncbi:MAG: hypothetical protein O8C66_14465 [Candidatus Methanoperedens sp.]|nr:hypothetical protein [Candidatus Methanoperedens sp.]MCZ7371704.1 hypothetical protein [Candidatus Methanoperedens sp.]
MMFLRSENGESEVTGHLLILSLTLIGVGMITVLSMSTIYNLQDMLSTKNAEQTFNIFNMYATQAIIGQSPSQIVNMNLGGGAVTVEPNSTGRESYITIKREKINDIVTIPMGKVTYRNGDWIVAYEGGGVWSKYHSSASAMQSPPKFDYNGVTLTIADINIRGNGSAGGKGIASVFFKKDNPLILYPNASVPNMTNPVQSSSGAVYVNVTSDFYDAWAEYARSLKYATVSTNSTTRTASIKLSTVPVFGSNNPITNPITLRGLDPSNPTPVNDFSFRLVPYGGILDWDIYFSSGTKTLIFHIKGGTNPGNKIDIFAGYEDDGSGYLLPAETWDGTGKLVVQGQTGNVYLDVDLLSTSLNLSYNKKDVGTGTVKIPGKYFNGSNFSWPSNPPPYKWFFNKSNESWVFSNTAIGASGTVVGTNITTDGVGAPLGSLSSNMSLVSPPNLVTSRTTWRSPNFTSNRTPVSAVLNFSFKVARFTGAGGSWTYSELNNYSVFLIDPNGTIKQIYQTTPFNETTPLIWNNISNSPIDVTYFNITGNYGLLLAANLTNQEAGGKGVLDVRWDNPTITLNYDTNRSLSEITQHYIQIMAPDGDVSFFQAYAAGRQPSSDSTMLLDYNSTNASIYMFVSQNIANVSIR